MKKTLVALAVAAVAATSANAAVVYNQDGTKVDVGGSVRVLLTKAKDQRTDLQNAGSRLEIRASHDLGEGLKALAYGRLNLGDESFNGVVLNKLYAGFDLDGVGALTFGRQQTNGDDVGLSDYTYNLGGINRIVTEGDRVARFTSADFHGLKFGLDYVFGNSNKKEVNDRAYVLSAFYDQKFGDVGFGFHAGYSHQKVDKNVSNKAFTLATELSYGPFAFAVDYSQAKSSNSSNQLGWYGLSETVKETVAYADPATASVKTEEVDVKKAIKFNKVRDIELGLKYQVTEKSKLYTVFSFGKATLVERGKTEKVKRRGYIFGADYQVHPQVVTYVEGGVFRTKHDSDTMKDHKVNLGLRVFF